jgi:putative LysE/RhtB family amino acid efflux pump
VDFLSYFSKAFIVGFFVAIPVGPVGLLLIQRSLALGALAGVCTGLGAALADALFGFLAALGLITLLDQLETHRALIRPLGSLALVIVGLYFYFHRIPSLNAEEVLTGRYQRRYWWDTISAFFLTLLNPTTIIAFAAIFAGSDLIAENPKDIQYIEITSGIFAGSLMWWLILVALAGPIKRRMNPHTVHRVFQGIGVSLCLIALGTLLPRLVTFIRN